MSYYSGTAASLAALRDALLVHAQADGWTLTGDVLSKAGVYFRIQVTATNITCLGCESNAVANPAPNLVQIGRIFQRSGYTTREISFPCSYEVLGFAQELYMVVNYDVDAYQWMAFGKSTVPGLPGQGGWFGATGGPVYAVTTVTDPIAITPSSGGSTNFVEGNSAALFYADDIRHQTSRNCYVNHGLDGAGWAWSSDGNTTGIRWSIPLHGMLPNVWNSEALLLPLRAYRVRPSYKSSLIASLDNARITRIDNLAPGDILTIGPDRWKVFPWYRKSITSRNGGTNINHTGTMGWTIRYEGP